MNLRYVTLIVALGVTIWMWSSNPRVVVAGEAAEPFQKVEIWRGGRRASSPPERRSTPSPQPVVAKDDAAKTTIAAGEQGEEPIDLEQPQSSDAAGDPAAAQVADTPATSGTDSPIAAALDECLRQNRTSLLEPPRPLRERSRGGNTHEQVSYVTPRVEPSASSGQDDDLPTAAESPATKAASISTLLVGINPRQDTAAAGRTGFSSDSPQGQARAGAAGSTLEPGTAGANQPSQSNLTEILTLLGIATLVFIVLRRWGTGKAHREPTAVS